MSQPKKRKICAADVLEPIKDEFIQVCSWKAHCGMCDKELDYSCTWVLVKCKHVFCVGCISELIERVERGLAAFDGCVVCRARGVLKGTTVKMCRIYFLQTDLLFEDVETKDVSAMTKYKFSKNATVIPMTEIIPLLDKVPDSLSRKYHPIPVDTIISYLEKNTDPDPKREGVFLEQSLDEQHKLIADCDRSIEMLTTLRDQAKVNLQAVTTCMTVAKIDKLAI
jgi:hypothetical protein